MSTSELRIYDLIVEGYRFRAKASPDRLWVDWLDCPSVYVPSGFSMVFYTAAEPGRASSTDAQDAQDAQDAPDAQDAQDSASILSEDYIREEIRQWLSNLEELDELGTDAPSR